MGSTILVVDNDLVTCRLLQRVLTPQGYTVETAADGPTALLMLAASPPDLLITDLMMPGLTGWSVVARARQQVPMLPTIVMSGIDTGDPRATTPDADQAAHTVVLRKPFALDELRATVARLLAGTQPERGTSIVPRDDEDAAER